MSIFAAMIDFIHTLLFGLDYPGLVKALDPITIGLLVGQGVQQIGKMVEAKNQEEAAREQMRQGKDLYDKMVSEFESGKYDVNLSQDVRDTAEQQRILAEQVADQAAQRGTASIQSALAATRYGDPRSGALIPGQLQKVEAGIQQAELAGLQQKVAADTAVASAQQRIDEQNKQLQQSLGAMKLGRGAAGMDAGQLAAQQAKAARIAAATGLASTVGQGLAMGIAGAGAGTKSDAVTPTPGTTVEDILRKTTPNSSSVLDDSGNLLGIQELDLLDEGIDDNLDLYGVDKFANASLMDKIAAGEFTGRQSRQGMYQPMTTKDLLGLLSMAGRNTLPVADVFADPYAMGPFPQMKDGGQYEFANKGGEVHMTEGEFSHKTNKKALIDEETGEKEAELTGDEAMVMDGENMLVFNPKQQSTIEALVNKGDANGLMKKMKALLKKFNKENV